MGEGLTVTVRSERGVSIAAVTGDIDISTVTQLRGRLLELAGSGRTLIVDLNRVTFIDSAGLGTLVGVARRAAAHGGSLYAVCARPATRKLLWLTGVNRRIPLAATVDGALMFMAASQDAPGERSAGHSRPGPYGDDARRGRGTLTTCTALSPAGLGAGHDGEIRRWSGAPPRSARSWPARPGPSSGPCWTGCPPSRLPRVRRSAPGREHEGAVP